jgi:ribosome recycling factor
MIKEILQDARERMEKTIEALHTDLRAVRTGRASPALLERVHVEYYGVATPLNQLAGITVPEARLLVIRPWDRNTLGVIEKALLKSDLGLTPNNDGQVIRLVVPQLTEERRRDLSKQVARRVEEARVSVRNIRRDAIDMLRDLEKEQEKEKGKLKDKGFSEDEFFEARDKAQELTDDFIKQIDEIGKAKEVEILEG